jgi:hypothetical protein
VTSAYSSSSCHSAKASSATSCCASTSSGATGHAQRVELAAAHAVEQRRRFGQVVARAREQPALGHAADVVAGAADALQEGGDAARGADLHHQVDVADVDAELERGGGDQHLQLAGLQALLGVQAQFARQAAVVRGHALVAQALAEVARRALGHAPRVDEHQRGAVLAHQLRDALVDLLPLVVRHHRRQRRRRQFQRQVALLGVADVDQRAVGAAVAATFAAPTRKRATSSIGFCVADRPMRCRRSPPDSDCSRSSDSDRCEPRLLAATAWISSTITLRTLASMRRPDSNRAARTATRRGDQDVRRALAHACALAGGRVAGAHGGADVDVGSPSPAGARGCPPAAPRGSGGCRSTGP